MDVRDRVADLSLDRAIARLRLQEEALRARGVAGLFVFGSVVRGEADADSDVDLLVDFAQGARPNLVRLASLRAAAADWLGVAADVVDRGSLRQDIRTAAEREAVRVF